jgi:hypothetical protein
MTTSLLKFKTETGLENQNGNLIIRQHFNIFNTGQVSYFDNVVKRGDLYEIWVHNELVIVEITERTFSIIQQPLDVESFIKNDSGQLCQLVCECIDFNKIELHPDASEECKYIFQANEKQKKLCGSYAEVEHWGVLTDPNLSVNFYKKLSNTIKTVSS